MNGSPRGAGGVDWLQTWREMYDAERVQAERIPLPDAARAADCWAGQAQRFAAAARRARQPDAFMRFLLPRLRPSDVVLDIGAGSGRYVPLLARAAARVVALEPSAAMRAQLEARLGDEALEHVAVIGEPWPMAAPPACDVAIAAHVVYSVREIGPFLQAMDAAAARACYIYAALQHPAAFIGPFWERFHGEPRRPLPGALECLNALHQLGIPANMALLPLDSRVSFLDAQEALDDIRWRLRLAPDAARDAAILAAARELLDRDADGRLVPRGQPRHAAVLWWCRDTAAE